MSEPGGPEVLQVCDLDPPTATTGGVVIDVAAAGLNRADISQRRGFYAPPPGTTDVFGLECSGVISAVGDDAGEWSVGDRVCALLDGGGYAEQVAVAAGQVLPAPSGLDLVGAAGLPEVACTVWSNVFMLAGLRPDERLLVHGGSGGIGTTAIQLGKALGATVLTTVGSAEKAAVVTGLGADLAINYRDEDFVEVIRSATDGHGVDVILDNIGAKYLARNVESLAVAGRLVVIGLQGGAAGELDLGLLMRKRAAVLATGLRARPAAEKAAIVAAVREHVWPLVEEGTVKPIVHTVLPLESAIEAHELMESSAHIGKILLTPRS
jgi:putative PIG3 family NAD(P)H quinone oxidoreductase